MAEGVGLTTHLQKVSRLPFDRLARRTWIIIPLRRSVRAAWLDISLCLGPARGPPILGVIRNIICIPRCH